MVHAELLPDEKAMMIENFKKDGLTAMIGDGINDAPALAAADVGISMGISGSALAVETGHAILMSNDIRKIPEAIHLAKRTFRKLVQNVVFSIATKGSVLALALAGYPLVWLAVLTDVGTCLIVILNSMLLLNDKHKNKRIPKRPKYGFFIEDKSEPLLEKQIDCSEGCCSNVSHKVKPASATKHEASCSDCGHSDQRLLEGGHGGKLESETGEEGCCGKVRWEEETSCSWRTKRRSDCCEEKNTETQIKTEKCGSGRRGSRKCCIDRVIIPEIVIE